MVTPTSTDVNTNYYQYCSFRLPCGVCTRTNTICPLNGSTIGITWQGPGAPYATVTDQGSTTGSISNETKYTFGDYRGGTVSAGSSGNETKYTFGDYRGGTVSA